MKRKQFALYMALIWVCTCLGLPAFAAETAPSDVVVRLSIDNPIMEVNGERVEIDTGRGTAPVIQNGRTLLPIRAVVEAFGGKVGWDDAADMVTLEMAGDKMELFINSKTAYLNREEKSLDVAPVIIGERTMLPIRFVAEGFSLGVAWDAQTRSVYVIQNALDDEEYEHLTKTVPAYSGKPYVEINQNVPYFKAYEKIPASFEFYGKQDALARCNVCMASVAPDLMPDDARESIQSVRPTGWQSAAYDTVPGRYLYNRCHLIGFQLTGENANEKNLITGTRSLNIDGMLPFENAVADYVKTTGNHVVYRVTPLFKDRNLVADGVLMEAYSIEDHGAGLSFCVYAYNTQPGIVIDYQTGESRAEGSAEADAPMEAGVYRTPTGKRYHVDAECAGKNARPISLEDAKAAGLTPCQTCAA